MTATIGLQHKPASCLNCRTFNITLSIEQIVLFTTCINILCYKNYIVVIYFPLNVIYFIVAVSHISVHILRTAQLLPFR